MLVIALGIIGGVFYFLREQASQPPITNITFLPTSIPTIPSEATVIPPTPLPIPTNAPSVLLVIPQAKVGANIVPVFLDDNGSWDVSQLGGHVGHLKESAWIDHPGNIVLVGHVELKDGRPGIFAYIKTLNIGDEIILAESGASPWIYEVDNVEAVEPNDLSVLYPSIQNKLTLITCDNYDFVSNTYLKRTVVTAKRMS
jgi:LPXTG-site transpeptidase (sortase) family protein